MGILKVYAEIMDEAPKLEKDYGLEYHAAIRKAKEMYKDQLKEKNHLHSDQTNEDDNEKILNDILTDKLEIDNYGVYKKDGQTLRGLDEV